MASDPVVKMGKSYYYVLLDHPGQLPNKYGYLDAELHAKGDLVSGSDVPDLILLIEQTYNVNREVKW